MTPRYINLKFPAVRRLAALRKDFDEWFVKNPHAPRDRVQSWRDVRFYTLASETGLDQGLQDEEPVWYGHNGPYFRDEKFVDEILDRHHTGWYTEEDGTTYKDGSGLARGIVGRLPHGRFIAGYWWGDNGERVYWPEIFDDQEDAARMADEHARVFAEQCREDNAKFNEARRIEDGIEDALKRLRECIALRNRDCMSYVRAEIEELIEKIRESRETLRTTYADYV